MVQPVRSSWESFMAALPGWVVLMVGLGLWAATMLLPAALHNEQMAWQRDVLRAQAEHVQRIGERYGLFREAVEAGDPQAVEMLAYLSFNMLPAGRRLDEVTATASTHDLAAPLRHGSVTPFLDMPLPRVGVELAAFEQQSTRLTRLAAGPYRLHLTVVAGLFIIAGLWWSARGAEAGSGPRRAVQGLVSRASSTVSRV